MFNFTTTNVVNVDKDLTSGKPLWSSSSDEPKYFNFLRVNKFYANNVTAIYKAEPVDPELAKITIDFSKIPEKIKAAGYDAPKVGQVFRLALYIGLTQASQDSRYANDLIYKGKPFTIDFVWLDTEEDSAEKTVAKIINDIKRLELAIYNNKILNYSANGELLTIEATNEYQRFKGLSVDVFMPLAYHFMGDYLPILTLADFDEVADNGSAEASMTWFKGKEGFGTFAYILHNLRIPTIERTRAFAPNQDESPIPGATYVQYTIHYCAKRGELGMNAVGLTVKSHTTHVFFVKSDLASDFESNLGNLDIDIETVPGE